MLATFVIVIQLYCLLVFCSGLPDITSGRQRQATPVPIPNVGYLGVGYNLLKGNPRPTTDRLVDPGFVGNAIYDMSSYKTGRVSADLRLMLPDNTEFTECNACLWETTTNIITGEESYRQSLFQQVALQGKAKFSKLAKLAFKASYSTQTVIEETTSMNHVLVDTSAACLVYCGSIMTYAKPPIFTQNFMQAIADLDDAKNATNNNNASSTLAAFRFIETFGTHVVTSVKLGSVFWERMTFDLLKWKKYASFHSLASIKTSAASSLFSSATRNSGSIITNNETAEFGAIAETRLRYSFGPPHPLFGNNASWQDLVAENPMPVKFSLMPISELFTSQHFPADKNIDEKRLFLEEMLQTNQYCHVMKEQGLIGDCNSLDPNDLGLPKLSSFGGLYCANCGSSVIGQYLAYRNNFTGEYNCPPGFEPAPLAVSETPQKAALILCSRQTFNDGTFGGMFTTFNCNGKRFCNSFSQQFYPNPFTGNFSCGGDYQAIYLSEGAVSNCCDSRTVSYDIVACFRNLPNGSLGGFYSTSNSASGRFARTLNPVTFATSCPKNYKAQYIATGTSGASSYWDIDTYVCN